MKGYKVANFRELPSGKRKTIIANPSFCSLFGSKFCQSILFCRAHPLIDCNIEIQIADRQVFPYMEIGLDMVTEVPPWLCAHKKSWNWPPTQYCNVFCVARIPFGLKTNRKVVCSIVHRANNLFEAPEVGDRTCWNKVDMGHGTLIADKNLFVKKKNLEKY